MFLSGHFFIGCFALKGWKFGALAIFSFSGRGARSVAAAPGPVTFPPPLPPSPPLQQEMIPHGERQFLYYVQNVRCTMYN